MWAPQRSARVLEEGDSLQDEAFYRVLQNTRFGMFAAYAAPVPASTTRSTPRWWNKATSGATSTTVAGRIAAEVATTNPTDLLLGVGVNDCQLGTDIVNVTMPNMNTILGAVSATCRIVYFDPLCWGELWPSGANGAVDTAIVLLSSLMQALLATPTYASRSTFVSRRHGIYDLVEPVLNPGNVANTTAPLTRPDTSGAHPNATGVGYITRLAMQNVSFTG